MLKILVTAGNVFDPSFYGVCFAIKKILGGVEAIYIFDTVESAKHAEKTQRNLKIREILGQLEVTTVIVKDEDLQTIIPEKLSRLINNYGTDQILVDLTNGQKITASVLYAVATISRITHIYALEWYTRPEPNKNLWDYHHSTDWNYIQVQALKEILNITQSSQVELIYYRDLINNVITTLSAKNLPFAIDTKDRLEHSLLDYFTSTLDGIEQVERLERSVNGLGKICEDIAILWHEYCFINQLLTSEAKDFNARLQQVKKLWGEYRKQSSSNNLDLTNPNIVNDVIPTLLIDTLLEPLQIYRNMASHNKRHYHYSKQDTRLVLDMVLLILNRLSKSNILDRP